MSITVLFFYKFVLAAVVVVILSLVAEHVNPRWAGLLSGLPTGSAITLYFYAYQYGLEFAGHSAIYNMIGLVAMQMFIFCYYICGVSIRKHKVLASICGGFVGYCLTIIFLSYFPVTTFSAISIPLFSFFVFHFLFRNIPNLEIKEKKQTTWKVIIVRASVAALTISFITGVAKIVGHEWAGLFSAFPTTLFPLLLIMHISYGEKYAHTIIKHVPDGLGGLLTYSLVLYLCYPAFGLYFGIILALGCSFIYLFLYHFLSLRLADRTISR